MFFLSLYVRGFHTKAWVLWTQLNYAICTVLSGKYIIKQLCMSTTRWITPSQVHNVHNVHCTSYNSTTWWITTSQVHISDWLPTFLQVKLDTFAEIVKSANLLETLHLGQGRPQNSFLCARQFCKYDAFNEYNSMKMITRLAGLLSWPSRRT